MNVPEDLLPLYKILEVPPGTSFAEIRRAYRHLRKLYAEGSIALDALMDDDDRRLDILSRIEKAYETLAECLGETAHDATPSELSPELRARLDTVVQFSGKDLRMVRESLGIGLDQVARSTRIGREYLGDIEKDRFDALPPPVFLRGYVSVFAEYLGLDGARVARDFMARYDASRSAGR